MRPPAFVKTERVSETVSLQRGTSQIPVQRLLLRGAEPGDTLEVCIKAIERGPFAHFLFDRHALLGAEPISFMAPVMASKPVAKIAAGGSRSSPSRQ